MMNESTIGYEQRDERNLINRINRRVDKINGCIRQLTRLQRNINIDMNDLRELRNHNG